MGYACRVERHSCWEGGKHELLSFVITFPREVLAEVVTHRRDSDTWGWEASWCERTTDPSISKNSASSRAIPIEKMIQRVEEDPYVPQWTLAQKGMQGAELSDESKRVEAEYEWLEARKEMILRAKRLNSLGIHKQHANRLLEPWMWVTQVVTSSRWDNFFALRCHKAAHPAFQRIARMMYLARRKSTPQVLEYPQWHLPFVPKEEQDAFNKNGWAPVKGREVPATIKTSVARCAWTSYENHDADRSFDAAQRTWDRLFSEVPIHASPCEHQATVLGPNHTKTNPELISNLSGWLQLRKVLPNEEVTEYKPSEEEIQSWELE